LETYIRSGRLLSKIEYICEYREEYVNNKTPENLLKYLAIIGKTGISAYMFNLKYNFLLFKLFIFSLVLFTFIYFRF